MKLVKYISVSKIQSFIKVFKHMLSFYPNIIKDWISNDLMVFLNWPLCDIEN